jgi:hypothetical protein
MAVRFGSTLAFIGAATLILCFSLAVAESLSSGGIEDELQASTMALSGTPN